MKQLIRIASLVLVLILLVGCSDPSNPEVDKSLPTVETTVQLALTEPIATTATTIIPTDSVPTETTAPTETTVPADTTTPTETTVPADTTAPTETTEPTAAPIPAVSAGFGAVYSDICRLLDTGSWDLEYIYAHAGMMEVTGYQSTKEERYSSITYALEDMDNDGNPEMIVLDAMGNTRILAIFTLQAGQPVMTHEGWARSRLYKLSDGTLYHEGSGGAAYSIFEAYGQCWFTYPKGEDQMEVGFYYAADGVYDPSTAQEITADEYNAKQVELAQKITAFSVYYFN